MGAVKLTVKVEGEEAALPPPLIDKPPAVKVPCVNEPPPNFVVSITVGVFVVKLSVPWVNEPPLKEPLVNEPPLNFVVSIAVGTLAVKLSLP